MAKQVVRYLLEGDGTVPLFVENGGYWPVGAELVGVSVDENERYVPPTVVRMNRADLEARLAGMTIKNLNQEELDGAAKAALLDAWLEMVGLPNLA